MGPTIFIRICPSLLCRDFALQCIAEDYFRVLVDEAGIQGVLDELNELTNKEQLGTIAAAYAAVRHGKLFLISFLKGLDPPLVIPKVDYMHNKAGLGRLARHSS